jgi:hypothetical protein
MGAAMNGSGSFCDGKQRFKSFSDASRIARLSAGRQHTAMRAYHCLNCGGFHFGNAMRPKSFNRRPEQL